LHRVEDPLITDDDLRKTGPVPHDEEGHRGEHAQTVYPALDPYLGAGRDVGQLSCQRAGNGRFSSRHVVTSNP